MQLLIWVVTGLLAGWLARLILGNRALLGILGDLTLGVTRIEQAIPRQPVSPDLPHASDPPSQD